MSGVVDKNGVQWERTNCCGHFVRIDLLKYEQPSEEHKYGRDICPMFPTCGTQAEQDSYARQHPIIRSK